MTSPVCILSTNVRLSDDGRLMWDCLMQDGSVEIAVTLREAP